MGYVNRLDKGKAWKAVQHKLECQNRRKLIVRLSRTVGYAAAVLVVCVVVWWQFLPQPDERIIDDITSGYKNDVLPGKVQAELVLRSEERRVGKECDSTCRYRGSP